MNDVSTPVIVFPATGHGGLAIVRSLGAMGVPVYAVVPDALTPACYSRHLERYFLWDFDRHSAERSVCFLLSLRKKVGRGAILFTNSDAGATFLAENADLLSPWFTFPKQSAGMVKNLCDKRQMHALASSRLVPVPATSYPVTRAEVASVAPHLTYPVMLKGIDGDRMAKLTRKRMVIVGTPEELLRTYDDVNDPRNLMLQAYIPGPESNCWIFHGYFNARSECLLSFTGQKLRQCRAYAGATSLGVCRRNAALELMLVQFLRAIGYSGLVDICLRYDERDGQHKVLDVNPRIGANFRLFVGRAGGDLARACYLDLTGQTVPPDPVAEGRKWMVEDFDLVSSIRYYGDKYLTAGEWLSSIRGIDEFGYLSWTDPLPAAARLVADLRECNRRLWAAAARRRPSTTRQVETVAQSKTEAA